MSSAQIRSELHGAATCPRGRRNHACMRANQCATRITRDTQDVSDMCEPQGSSACSRLARSELLPGMVDGPGISTSMKASSRAICLSAPNFGHSAHRGASAQPEAGPAAGGAGGPAGAPAKAACQWAIASGEGCGAAWRMGCTTGCVAAGSTIGGAGALGAPMYVGSVR